MWAVHILDGVLQWPWLLGGFLLAGALAWLGTRGLKDEDIPRTAVLSSAFFVATLIHIPVILPGTRVHLLLNGLVGIILGPRSALAIPLALLLQALLLGHGGLTTLGVNSCIMVLPALAAWGLFCVMRRYGALDTVWGRWLTGLAVGALSVLASSVLNSLVLWLGSSDSLETLALVVFVAHLPIAAVEGVIMAATISFLAKVKPEMLGLRFPAVAVPLPPGDEQQAAG